MKTISTEELINNKVLPYNIYSEFGEKLFAAGEILTPGKLLQLRHLNVLYRDDNSFADDSGDSSELENQEEAKQEYAEIIEEEPEVIQKVAAVKDECVYEIQDMIIESFDMKPSTILRNKLSVDDIDIMNYRGPINKKAKIDPQTQLKIKAFYTKILEMMDEKPPMEMLGMFANIRDKIIQDIILEHNEIILSSQLKLLGEYKKCHALNTAILSGALAKKMNVSENALHDIVLAGLLHDIGKNQLPPELLSKSSLTSQEQKTLQEHTKIGYRIIRVEMKLPENIAKVAFDHHENNDGSGYPSGKSADKLNQETQIINVCNYFDNLTSNRTHHKIRNTKEAIRVMLELGTQRFSADALYTFVNMFSYNDTVNFEEMIL